MKGKVSLAEKYSELVKRVATIRTTQPSIVLCAEEGTRRIDTVNIRSVSLPTSDFSLSMTDMGRTRIVEWISPEPHSGHSASVIWVAVDSKSVPRSLQRYEKVRSSSSPSRDCTMDVTRVTKSMWCVIDQHLLQSWDSC